MTTMNTSKLLDLIGQLKVVTLVIGVIDIGLTASAYFRTGTDEYFLAMVCIAFILSLIFVVFIIVGVIPVTDMWKKIDMIYHGVIAILLAIGVLCMLISLFQNKTSGSPLARRCFAVVFGLANTVIYGYISFGIYRAPDV